MPELPEVETLRRELERVLVGQIIKTGKVFWPGTVAPLSSSAFVKKLSGQKITAIRRRAKILLLSLSPSQLTLAIHLKLTGQLVYHPLQPPQRGRDNSPLLRGGARGGVVIGGHPEDPTKHTRAIFHFTDGSQLYFNDLRKFGWLKLLSSNSKEGLLARLGREPLSKEFGWETFKTILQRYPNRRLKQTLLDQTLIAGLGNIYVDESCLATRVMPDRRVKKLTDSEIKKLHRAIQRILKLAIREGGTSARNYVRSDGRPGGFVPYLKVYGRTGKPCKNCRSPITKVKLLGRGTHFCPQFQK